MLRTGAALDVVDALLTVASAWFAVTVVREVAALLHRPERVDAPAVAEDAVPAGEVSPGGP